MKNNFNYFGKYRKLCQLVFFSLFSLSIFTSCSQDRINEDITTMAPAEPGGLKKLGDLTLQKNVMILNDESVSSISTLNNQGITFTRATAQTDSIKIGTVIVGTKLEGDNVTSILSKVTSVSKINNQFTVQTSSAKLEEFIYSGTISGVYDPAGKAPINVNGKMVNYIPVENFVSQEMNNKISAIGSKNLNNQKLITLNRFFFERTFGPQISVGSVGAGSKITVKGGFTPKIDYKISFSWGHLVDFDVNFIMDDINLQALANINGAVGFTASVADLANIPVLPIVLGPTGFIFSPTIAAGPFVEAKTTGKVQGNIFDLKGKGNVFVGTRIPGVDLDFTSGEGPSLTDIDGDLTGEAGIEIKGGAGLQWTTISLASSGFSGRISGLSKVGLQLIPTKKGILDVKGSMRADIFAGVGIGPLRIEKKFPLAKKEISIYHKELLF